MLKNWEKNKNVLCIAVLFTCSNVFIKHILMSPSFAKVVENELY